MRHDSSLPLVANNILSLLAHEARPMTKSEMAKELGKTFQTIANNMHVLLARNLIVEHSRIGNAMRFTLGDPSESLVHINWRGEDRKLIDVVKEFASDTTPVEMSVFARRFLKLFSELYRLSADAIDDDNPKPITLAQIKELQASVSKSRTALRQLLATCDSLLEYDALWDPRAIVNELIIKDPEMDQFAARSYSSNISERLSGGNS